MIELLEKYDDECLPEESNQEDRTPEDREDDGMPEGGDDDYESVDDGAAIVLARLRTVGGTATKRRARLQ